MGNLGSFLSLEAMPSNCLVAVSMTDSAKEGGCERLVALRRQANKPRSRAGTDVVAAARP